MFDYEMLLYLAGLTLVAGIFLSGVLFGAASRERVACANRIEPQGRRRLRRAV